MNAITFLNPITKERDPLQFPTWEAFASMDLFPSKDASPGLLYLAKDTGLFYRWSETNLAYIQLGKISGAPYDGGSVAMAFTPDRSNGELQKFSMLGDATMNAPVNGSAGDKLISWITAPSGGANLAIDTAVLVPSDSSFSGSKALTGSKLYIVQLQNNGASWMLTSLVGGY